MATKIKLMRMGKMRAPYYRIVVADARTKRDGRSIEEIGKYHPKQDPSFIEVDSDRVQYWLGVGAQPTEAVATIRKVTGDWQKFKGLPAPEPMLVAAPKADKKSVFEEAARAAAADSAAEATTPKKRAPKAEKTEKAADKAADSGTPTADQQAAAAGEQGETLTEARADAGDTAAAEPAADATATADAPAAEAPAADAAAEPAADAPAAEAAPADGDSTGE